MYQQLFFYLFEFVLLVAALGVVFSKQTIHSVLFLILCFFNASALFLLLNAEFVAMVLVIVYVGAVAVLFLFVVMMLDTGKLEEVKRRSWYRMGFVVGSILMIQMIFVSASWFLSTPSSVQEIPVSTENNTKAIGKVLYTDYFTAFQFAGIILLVAMIGAVILTMRQGSNRKKQKVSDQLKRSSDSLRLYKVSSHSGMEKKI